MIRFNTKCELTAAAGKPVKVAGVLYAGGIMHVAGFGNIVIVIAGMEVTNPVTMLADHDNAIAAVAGSVNVTKTATQITVNGTLSNSPAGVAIAGLLADGVRLQMSVGATPGKTRRINAGEKVSVNGRELVAPASGLTVIESSKLREATATPLGADDSTSLLIAARRGRNTTMDTFEAWCVANEITTDNISAKALAKLKATYEAEQGGGVATADDRAERISACARAWMKDRPEQTDEILAAADKAIAANSSAMDFERDMLRGMRADPAIGRPRRHSSDANPIEVLSCALGRRAGLPIPEKAWSPQTLEAADRLAPMVPVIMRAVAMKDERTLQASGFSTYGTGMGEALSNLANKGVQAVAEMFPITSPVVAVAKSATNFHPQSSFLPHIKDGRLEEVGAGGELKHVSPDATKRTHQAKTFGKMLLITYQSLVNDDLGIWGEQLQELARQGLRTREHEVYRILLANAGSFFSTGNLNFDDGVDTVLSATSLEAAMKMLRNRTDADDMPIGLVPKTLLVPPSLEVTGRMLVESTELARDLATDMQGTASPFKGLSIAVEPRLESTAIHANASATAWYLVCEPAQCPPVVLTYLNGKETPVLQEIELPGNVLGKGWRIVYDFGADLFDGRGIIKMKGAV